MYQGLSPRLEFAILDILMGPNPDTGMRQANIAQWMTFVVKLLPDRFNEVDLIAAFVRLWTRKQIRLSKVVGNKIHGRDYSGNQDDNAEFFYYIFNTEIWPEGRSRWDELRLKGRNGVFISHIHEEKGVAKVLQKYLRLAFGDDFRVFVSTDETSIAIGEKWYNYIIDNLRISEVIIVLLSQESKRKEWINFEAGFGEGAESLVMPLAINNTPLSQFSFPLAGIQAQSIDSIGIILSAISDRIGVTAKDIDIKEYLQELRTAEEQLTYKSLVVAVFKDLRALRFKLSNVGNVDLELLMLEVLVPRSIATDERHTEDGTGESAVTIEGVPYFSFSCYSARGVYASLRPLLRPIITPSMGKVTTQFVVPIDPTKVRMDQLYNVYYQLHAVSYRSERQAIEFSSIPMWED